MIAAALVGLLFCAALVWLFVSFRKMKSVEAQEVWDKEDLKEAEASKEEPKEPVKYIVDDKVVDDVPQYAFVFVKYRDMVFSMRANEKTEIWDKMNRTQRNTQLDQMKKAEKRKEIRIEKLAEGVWCYVPMRAKTKDMLDNYNKFISLGGKLEDGK